MKAFTAEEARLIGQRDKALAELAAVTKERDELREALIGLVGVETQEELSEMKKNLNELPIPQSERVKLLSAISALEASHGE